MSGMIQIRNVPNELHRRLKARAALAGMTLSGYLLHEIRRVAERPSLEELRAKLDQRSVATDLLDVEVTQVLRRYALAGEVKAQRCRAALDDLAGLPLTRYPHGVLMARVWDLRDNLSAYDAVYIALAEALDAPLLTRDQRLAKAPAHRARVELV
jgi:predicted nucleic acid-binding protein